jgi:threonine dehydratase
VLNKLAGLSSVQRARGVIAASSGNHAQALAYCAREQRLDCVVVMPRGSSPQKVDAAREYGAAIDQECDEAADAVDRAERLAADSGRTLVPAYDDDQVIAGQATIGLELLEQVPDLDLVAVPVSGGGLVAGVALAIKSVRPRVRIVAVEPELAPRLAAALEAGHPVSGGWQTIADGLGAPAIGERCLGLCERYVDEVVQVADGEIIQALQWIYANAKLACEPAGAAAAGAVLAGKVEAGSGVAVIVSGGNVGAGEAAAILGRQ